MQDKLTVLVSNTEVPTTKIGSWTTRLTQLIQSYDVFDFILSPTSVNQTSIFCKKRKFLSWRKAVRRLNLKYWVAKDYISAISRLSKKASDITVVVMDDVHLLEAIALSKLKFRSHICLVFSFHGFRLELNHGTLKLVDKILFLSEKAYEVSNINDLSKKVIVGNGVKNADFYPLSNKDYRIARQDRGYTPEDEILIWAANDRPKKGFHIFEKVTEQLLKIYPHLKIIIIGTKNTIPNKNILNVGRVHHREISKYMQISNYYMFTTLYEEGFGLSMIEALKCGNTVIASNKGAISEVLGGKPQSYLIDNPENIDEWITTFDLARKDTDCGKNRLTKCETDVIWSYNDWEHNFINAILER
ncbi:MAG: glycosyltransferase family 4 protein [Jejuia sp.]